MNLCCSSWNYIEMFSTLLPRPLGVTPKTSRRYSQELSWRYSQDLSALLPRPLSSLLPGALVVTPRSSRRYSQDLSALLPRPLGVTPKTLGRSMAWVFCAYLWALCQWALGVTLAIDFGFKGSAWVLCSVSVCSWPLPHTCGTLPFC